MKKLTKGQVVMIYEDPVTELKPEGKARLIVREGVGRNGLETWKVRFIDDGFTANRIIKT
jgi:hypothetical protein